MENRKIAGALIAFPSVIVIEFVKERKSMLQTPTEHFDFLPGASRGLGRPEIARDARNIVEVGSGRRDRVEEVGVG